MKLLMSIELVLTKNILQKITKALGSNYNSFKPIGLNLSITDNSTQLEADFILLKDEESLTKDQFKKSILNYLKNHHEAFISPPRKDVEL